MPNVAWFSEEIIDDLNICEDEKYVEPKLIAELKLEADKLLTRLNGYIAYLRKSKQGS